MNSRKQYEALNETRVQLPLMSARRVVRNLRSCPSVRGARTWLTPNGVELDLYVQSAQNVWWKYLPKKASSGDTEKLVDDFLAKNAFTEKQFGQAMGQFMKAHGATVDPAAANTLLKQKLAGK